MQRAQSLQRRESLRKLFLLIENAHLHAQGFVVFETLRTDLVETCEGTIHVDAALIEQRGMIEIQPVRHALLLLQPDQKLFRLVDPVFVHEHGHGGHGKMQGILRFGHGAHDLVHPVALQQQAEEKKTGAAVFRIIGQQSAIDALRFLRIAQLFLGERKKLPCLGVFGILPDGGFQLSFRLGKTSGHAERLRIGKAYGGRQLLFGNVPEHLHGLFGLSAAQKGKSKLRLRLAVGRMPSGKAAQKGNGIVSLIVLDEKIGLQRRQCQIVRHLLCGPAYQRHGVLFVIMGEQPDGCVDDGSGGRQTVGAGPESQKTVGGVDHAFPVVAGKGAVELELCENKLRTSGGRLCGIQGKIQKVLLSRGESESLSRGRASYRQQHEGKRGGQHQTSGLRKGEQVPSCPEKGRNMAEHGVPVGGRTMAESSLPRSL